MNIDRDLYYRPAAISERRDVGPCDVTGVAQLLDEYPDLTVEELRARIESVDPAGPITYSPARQTEWWHSSMQGSAPYRPA